MSGPETMAQLVAKQAAERPDADLLTFVDVGADGALIPETRSFRQLRDNGRRLGAWLQSVGVGPGDRVALMLHNHPEFVEAMIAAAHIGAVFVPLDPRSVGDKLVYMLNFVEAKSLVAGDYAVAAVAEVAGELTHTADVLVVGDAPAAPGSWPRLHAYAEAMAMAPGPERAPDPDSPMFMMFTSGTTGRPKAVVRTHAAHMAGVGGMRVLGVLESDRLYTGLPLSHINAQSTLGTALALGMPAVFSRRFTKTNLWRICREYGCTTFPLLGGMIPEVFSLPETPEDADNPVRMIVCHGMPATLWDAYKRRYRVELTEVYGSTEAGGLLINLNSEGPAGSMGKTLAGTEAAVLRPDDSECEPGELGELCFRPTDGAGPRPVTYHLNAEASAEKTRSGWFRSGDIAHRDADGWFYFDHRAGGGVRRNGDFVSTGLVESVLAKSPLVEDVFVYGVRTPTTVAGEKVLVAAVVLSPGGSLEEVRAWAADKLQKNELPEVWQVLPAIPKTISEKPVERDCVELLRREGLVELAA